MKILKIELRNINSLKSDKTIVVDFESEAFREVGLFAITGATGAGKSTILDAITIALYQEVPRFNQSNIKANLEDVVSLGASEAYAAVLFETKGLIYESSWSMRLYSKSGKKLANPKEEVRLKNISKEKIIAEKKTELKKEIVNVTQLTYKQFLRSVLLAQGEFAAFLSANTKEKAALLEQITGEDIYQRVGDAILQRKADEKNKLEQLRGRINEEDLLSGEEALTLETEKQKIEAELKEIDLRLKHLTSALDWHKKEQSSALKLEACKADLEQLKVKKEAFRTQLIRLEKHKKTDAFVALINAIEEAEKSVKNNKDKIKQASLEKENSTQKDLLLKQEEQSNSNLLEAAEKTYQEAQPIIEQLVVLDTNIKTFRKQDEFYKLEEKENKERIETVNRQIEKETKEVERINKETEKLKLLLKEKRFYLEIEQHLDEWNTQLNRRKFVSENRLSLKKILQKNSIAFQRLESEQQTLAEQEQTTRVALELLRKQLKENEAQEKSYPSSSVLYEKKSACETAARNLEQLIALSGTFKQKNKDRTLLLNDLKIGKQAVLNLEEKKQQQKELLEQAEKAWYAAQEMERMQRKITDLNEERKHLKEGKACPLCGSTHHPFAEEQPLVEDLSAVSEAFKYYKQKGEALKVCENALSEKRSALALQQQKIKDLEEEANLVEQDFRKGLKVLAIPEGLGIEASDSLEKNRAEQVQEANHYAKKITELETLISQNKLDKQAEDKKQKALQNLILEKKRIDLDLENNKINTEERQKECADFEAELQTTEGEMHQAFQPFPFDLPEFEQTDTFLTNLRKGVKTYNEKLKRLESLAKDLELSVQRKENKASALEEERKKEKERQAAARKIQEELSEKEQERKALLPLDKSPESYRNELSNKKKLAESRLVESSKKRKSLETKIALWGQDILRYSEEQKRVTKQLNTQTELLNKRLEDSDFEDVEEIKAAVLEQSVFEQLKKENRHLQDQSLTLENSLSQLTKERVLLQEERRTDKAKEQIDAELNEKSHIKEGHIKRIGEIDEKFRLNDNIIKRNKGVYDAIKTQEQELDKWKRLMNTLGGSSHAFTTYVQRLTLKNLIYLANRHLLQLNARYALVMEEAYKQGEELDFKMIDHYLADEIRYVDTSSGGEKFIISLALALGLSDLSSQQVQIDSLFIDEGFGTLDNRTLDAVLSNLQTLQAQGKMIGIISHIENLKERIPTQIVLNKQQNGVSSLSVEY